MKWLAKRLLRKNVLDLLFHSGNYRLIFWLFSSNIVSLSSKSPSPKINNVLCLDRPIFRDDLKQLSIESNTLLFHLVPKKFFLLVSHLFLGELSQKHIHYFSDSNYQSKIAYRVFIFRLLHHTINKYGISCVVSANYVYAWQQEIAECCKHIGIPFIVIHKEGITGNSDYTSLVKRYTNNRFVGDKILTYNSFIRDALVNANIHGLNSSNCITVGVPRFNSYFPATPKKTQNITFFSFYIDDKLEHVDSVHSVPSLKQKADLIHAQILNFAINNPNYTLYVKTKANHKYLDYVERIYAQLSPNPVKNIIITNKGSANNYIRESSSIIAYNSITLVESVLSGCQVLTPSFEEFGISNFFPTSLECIKTFHDYNELTSLLLERKYSMTEIDKSVLDIKKFLGIPLFNPCIKIESEINKSIKSYHQNQT